MRRVKAAMEDGSTLRGFELPNDARGSLTESLRLCGGIACNFMFPGCAYA